MADAIRDNELAAKVMDHYYDHFHPDQGFGPVLFYNVEWMETCGLKYFKIPGIDLPPDQYYQYNEEEFMLAEEYPEAIRDLSSFMMNKWIPRTYKNLKGLEQIDLRESMWMGTLNTLVPFASQEVKDTLRTIEKAADQMMDWYAFLGDYEEHLMNDYGVVNFCNGYAYAPFDSVADTMRGTMGAIHDMYTRPDELLELVEIVKDISIKNTIRNNQGGKTPFIAYWLHKGVDDMMSDEQFAKFYWPSLRDYITAVADAGLVPVVVCEGKYNSRLEYLKEVPVGKVIYTFEYVDMAKAKKVLGDTACIRGNVPLSLMAVGEPKDVKESVKKLIDECAPGGGYMLDVGALVDNAKVRNVEAFYEAAELYGKY